jgi:CubicO group peptidase (beta-lactamase class C family)
VLALAGIARADKVDDYVKAEMQRQHLAGVSVAVLKEGKILKAEGYGMANIELNVAVRPDTVFKIGSVSKQFIATGIMLLVDEGKISLDDKISKYLEGTPETWKDITVRNLLTHTSGLVREAPGFDPLKIQNDADVIKTAYKEALRFVPGEKYEYCNVGYFSLAEIIRKVSGKPWPDFLKERVFAPAEMHATRTTTMTDLVTNRANGYAWNNNKFENSSIFFALRPSGAFLSTVLDLAKWDAMLYSDKILKQSLREQMWTPVKLNNGSTYPYGFGWTVDTLRGHKVVQHGGSLPGFRASFFRFVDDKLSVVVLTNTDNANAESLAVGIADEYLPDLIPERTAIKLDPKVLPAFVGQYQLNPTVAVTVELEGERLTIRQGTGTKRQLLPESELTFFINENRRSTYTFVKDAQGAITELVVHMDGRENWRAKKTN